METAIMWLSLLLVVWFQSLSMAFPGLFEGDIIMTGDRNAVVDEQKLWPEGLIFYELSESVESIRPNILKAMEEIEKKTCVKFLPKTSSTLDYVRIVKWNGCRSAIGRQRGEQITSLGFGCHFHGIILHELGHVIGLYHEHSRSDRDDYLDIFLENVESGMDMQFVKMKPWEHNLLLEEFDYESVMLYGEDAFTKEDDLRILAAKEPGLTIGPLWMKQQLSDGDVRRINRLYQCFGEVRPPAPETPNFECRFEEHCDLEILTSGLKLELFNPSAETGNVLLVEANRESEKERFALPFLEVFGQAIGCFSLDYYFPDNPTKSMRILKQDLEGTTEIATVLPERHNVWQSIEKNITLPDFGLRFIIEVQGDFEAETNGVVFLDNLNFSFYPCTVHHY